MNERMNDDERSVREEGEGVMWGTDDNTKENEHDAARGERGRGGGPVKGLNSGLETEQDRMVLAPPSCSLPDFCPWKTLVKE